MSDNPFVKPPITSVNLVDPKVPDEGATVIMPNEAAIVETEFADMLAAGQPVLWVRVAPVPDVVLAATAVDLVPLAVFDPRVDDVVRCQCRRSLPRPSWTSSALSTQRHVMPGAAEGQVAAALSAPQVMAEATFDQVHAPQPPARRPPRAGR